MRLRWPWHRHETDMAAAKRALDAACDDWPRVRQVAAKAAEQKRRNGFGDMVVRAFTGEPPR